MSLEYEKKAFTNVENTKIAEGQQNDLANVTLNAFKSWDATTKPPLGKKQKTTLTVFVVDSSMPGSNPRVAAVKGACGYILPRGKVAVVSCHESTAKTILEPTNSVLEANRHLTRLQKSVMGNLGIGMKKGIEIIKQEAEIHSISEGSNGGSSRALDSAVLVIVADSKAHGLMAASHNAGSSADKRCAVDYDICDEDLVSAASNIIEITKHLMSRDFYVKTIVVDTESSFSTKAKSADSLLSEEGFRLATISQAEYHHEPQITDDVLVRILSQVQVRPDFVPKPPKFLF